MRAEVSCVNLEKLFAAGVEGRGFLPSSAREVQEHILAAYEGLLAKVYLAEASVLELFTFFRDTEDGWLELKGVAELMEAVSCGYCSLKGLVDAAINALRFKDGTAFFGLEGSVIKVGEESFKVHSEGLKVKDFVLLRQEFFKRLSSFTLLEEGFAGKILAFVEPQMNPRRLQEVFMRDGIPDILGVYLFLFYCVENICGVKKNWIF